MSYISPLIHSKGTTCSKTSKASKCTNKHHNESKYRQLRETAYKRTFVAFSKVFLFFLHRIGSFFACLSLFVSFPRSKDAFLF